MKKVLLVEDDFYIRNLYKRAFEKKDYQVVEADDGEAGLKKVKKDKFDFIVLDLMLPGLPGLKVLEEVKKITDLPVYILTNVGDESVLRQAKSIGAEAYFIKVDYTPSQLVAVIEGKETSRIAAKSSD